MVESNVVTVTYKEGVIPPTISLTLTANKTSYNPSTDYLSFTVMANQDVTGKIVELYVDGQATGKRETCGGQGTVFNFSPNNYPSQLKAQGSHQCKVVSVGW